MESTIALFRSVRAEALDLGVRIALENHAGDMQAREVRTIIEESGKDCGWRLAWTPGIRCGWWKIRW